MDRTEFSVYLPLDNRTFFFHNWVISISSKIDKKLDGIKQFIQTNANVDADVCRRHSDAMG